MTSVVIPVYNGENTMRKTLQSLLSQQDFFNELIIVDDHSKDNVVGLIENFLSPKKISYKIIRHQKNQGLAASYNAGIKAAHGELVVLMHQDVILYSDSLKLLLQPLADPQVACAYHYTYQPFEIWQKYNFWQKYFFCRWVDKKIYGMNGKFDCFRRQALIDNGPFDETTFHSAGEDSDMLIRLKNKGKVIKSQAGILHLHDGKPNFNLLDIVKKQAQLSEAQGALFRKHGLFSGPVGLVKSFFREILLVALLIPYLNWLALILVVVYIFLISRQMYFHEYKNPRILILPFLNVFLLLVSLFFSARGFIQGRQIFH
ncbi:MAG: Glycosyl transferase family 2 [Candidatus Kuenenbacteria bacterium GW2011_GWA2_42_15]|uniref:Glycosyl transferase family 2 n=1 Tax=Candidatus Kuenenbacteria bacterium GW2011_GWA2_42_15 TaxID=1618677 RepID=A0A0G0Z0T9_9BACT|nr:MAG: Glycosyl transferase family 2 [Candidatus Kuenenbacteria bacterium GW2011_GWA2_42_15]